MATVYPHVEQRCGGHYVAGTRVPVRRLWNWHAKGIAFTTLVKRYPTLQPAWLLAALAFGYDNKDVIEAELERERAAADEPQEMKQLELPWPKRK